METDFDDLTIQAAFAQPDNNGRFAGAYGDYLRKVSARKPSAIFAFAPKAAGTFLRTAAIYALGGQLLRTVHAQGGRDAQFYLPIFLGYYAGTFGSDPMVSHVHMQALEANRHFIEVLDLKPVIMLRPIPDMLRSFGDMLDMDPQARTEGLNCPVPEDFTELSATRKADFLVDFLAPWYAGYYATWLSWVKEEPARICVLRYEQFRTDSSLELARSLAHSGLPRSQGLCRAALAKAWAERHTIRFHRGEDGRGRDYFTPEQFARIVRTLSYFPVLDEWRAELLPARAEDQCASFQILR